MTRKLLTGLALILVAQTAQAQTGTRDGAVLGGVGGAVIGGIIGHQNDETPEGALIGGAVGAVAGGLIGNARDKAERDRYYQMQQQQQWNQQRHTHYNTYRSTPTRTTTVVPAGVTIADVLSMTRNGVSESVIVNHIYTTGVQRRIDTNEIIMLHQQGVSENVINALQQAPMRGTFAGNTTLSGQATTTVVTPQGGTVIVQEPGTSTIYSRPNYNQPPYSQPSYLRPSYPTRRGF